ncbi:MAG: hypothetical protein AAFS10_04700, partial [Myxococcota bacterium]
QLTGMEDLLVDTVFANRTHEALDHTLGFMAENLVLRADLTGNPTLATMLGRVRTGVLEAWERHAWRSLFATDPQLREIALSPLCVNMQPPLVGRSMAGRATRLTPMPELTRRLMVHCLGAILYMFPSEEGSLHIDLVHNQALFSEAWARQALEQMQFILRTACTTPEVTLEALMRP